MGCTCIRNNNEQDFNAAKENKSLLKTNDGIKLKAGIKNKRDLLKFYSTKNLIELDNFRKEVLENINKHRIEHGVYPLTMNNEINNISQKHAEELSYINDIDYSENKYQGQELGESVYQSFKLITAEQLVNIWYEDFLEYNFDNPDPTHFSQMVWKSTKLFGLGVGVGPNNNFFFVANYFPIGNIPGQYLSNVFPKNTKIEIQNNKNINNHNYLEITNNTNYNYKDLRNNNTNPTKIINNDNENINNNSLKGFNNFCIEALQSHNKYRNLHHVPPLKLNKEICEIAQNYAENLANKNILIHSDNEYKGESLGENIFMCKGKEATGEYATKSWYDEIKTHNFNGDFQNDTGHFTQVIWKDSKEVGFGIAKNKGGYTYVVGNYFPAGNILGRFKQNVFKA